MDGEQTVKYLFSRYEFEAFCSNCCEYLIQFKNNHFKNMTNKDFFDWFNLQLTNYEKFIDLFKYKDFGELFIFCKLCQLIKKENRYNDYLKEILWEHLNG